MDSKLLNKQVFKNLKYLDVSGPINEIQDDLFKNFKLKLIRIRTQNARRIFAYKNKNMKLLGNYVFLFSKSCNYA